MIYIVEIHTGTRRNRYAGKWHRLGQSRKNFDSLLDMLKNRTLKDTHARRICNALGMPLASVKYNTGGKVVTILYE